MTFPGWDAETFERLCQAVAETIDARKAEVTLTAVYDTVQEDNFAEDVAFVEWDSENEDDRIETVTIEVQYLHRTLTRPQAYKDLRIAARRIRDIILDDDLGYIRDGGFGYVKSSINRSIVADLDWANTDGERGELYSGAVITLTYARGYHLGR